jgi:multiple sugar transport system ATP-binding protein
MSNIALKNVRKCYGTTEAVRGVTLEICDRQFAVFVGPSGCGKTTLLRLIAGLEELTDGEICIDGEKVDDVPPAGRGLAMVFQSYALYPHMTVAANLEFSLKLAGAPRADRTRRVLDAARILQLEPLLDRKPRELSGGQRQRVAIGRAIVRNPRAFLFDEPLSNLDAELRNQMRVELLRLHNQLNATTVYVTHDQVEAMTMADRIIVLREGKVEQQGAPLELYSRPQNLFVAGFIGSPRMNLLPGTVTEAAGAGLRVSLTKDWNLDLRGCAEMPAGGSVTVGIRPEHLSFREDGPLRGEVIVVERLGAVTFVHVRIESGFVLNVAAPGDIHVKPRDIVPVAVQPDRCHLFDASGQSVGLS